MSGHGTRLLRGARCSARRRPGRDPAGLPHPGPQVPPRRQQGPPGGGAVQGDQRGLQRPVRSGAASPLRPLRRGLPEGSGGLGGTGRRRCRCRCRCGRWSRQRLPVVHRGRPPGPVRHQRLRRRGRRRRRPVRLVLRGRRTDACPRSRPGGRTAAHRRGGLPGGRRTVTLAGPDGQRRYEVDVPPGVTDGRRIRLAGEGGRGSGDGSAGDLYLRVRIQPHPQFRLEGRDVYVQLPVTPGRPRWARPCRCPRRAAPRRR